MVETDEKAQRNRRRAKT